MTRRPDRDEYLMQIAEAASRRATCDRPTDQGVGCVLVDAAGHVLGTGYNGSPTGEPHCVDVGHLFVDGSCVRTVHAEANAVGHAARVGVPLRGSVAYVTVHPCRDCCKLLASAGVTEVVYRDPYRRDSDGFSRRLVPGVSFRRLNRPRITCIEGLDGCGKSSQATRLSIGHAAAMWKFPHYDTRLGGEILSALRGEWAAPGDRHGLVLQCMMTANRLECLDVVEMFLRDGNDVVFDRYWPSAVVYGGMDGLDEEWLVGLHSSLPQPDLFVLLDVPPLVCVSRRPDGVGYERLDRMVEAAERYRRLWHEMGEIGGKSRWLVLDGDRPIDEVAAELAEAHADLKS